MVSENHENVDLVLGIKNIFELEGVVDSCDSSLSFLNRSISFFPRQKVEVKPKEHKLIVVEVLVCRGNYRNGHNKLLDVTEQTTLTMKLKSF